MACHCEPGQSTAYHPTQSRKDALIKRAGKDPFTVGPQPPLGKTMDDEIPELRWQLELEKIQHSGYADLQSYLKGNFVKDKDGNISKK